MMLWWCYFDVMMMLWWCYDDVMIYPHFHFVPGLSQSYDDWLCTSRTKKTGDSVFLSQLSSQFQCGFILNNHPNRIHTLNSIIAWDRKGTRRSLARVTPSHWKKVLHRSLEHSHKKWQSRRLWANKFPAFRQLFSEKMCRHPIIARYRPTLPSVSVLPRRRRLHERALEVATAFVF